MFSTPRSSLYKGALRLTGFLWFLALGLSVSAWAKPGFPVLGYLPMYDSSGPYGDAINLNDNSKFPWDRLTHVMEAFAQPSSTGGVSFPIPQRANLVLKAHQNNTRCILSIGGAGSSNAAWSSAVGSTYRGTFVNNLVNACTTYGYDGIDIDWEFPGTGDKANFTAFMVALSAALKAKTSSCGGCAFQGQPLQLTFFVSPGNDICGVDWNDATLQAAVDFAVYGAYDFNAPPGYNSPMSMAWSQTDCRGVSYNFCLTQTTRVLTNGISPNYSWPKSKMVLSLPLYDKQTYSTFTSGTPVLVALKQGSFLGMDTPQDEARYSLGGVTHYVNNDTAYCRKMAWGISQGFAGFALWEISHAYPADDPAVSSLWSTIGGTAACVNVATPTPAPTPNLLPGGLVDIGSSGTNTNNWAGTWGSWTGTGSTVTMSYTAPGYSGSSYNGSGPYSIQASGTLGSGGLSVSTNLQPGGTAYNLDAAGYTRIDFWMKSTPGTYRLAFDRTATRATGNNHYGFDITVADNSWHYYSYYLADATQPAWGTAAPLAYNDVIALVFAPTSPLAAYQMNLDDIELVKQVVTATPTPPAGLLDTFEDGNSTNNWKGVWSSWAPAGSSISAVNSSSTGFPFSTYGSRYAGAVSGSNSTNSNIGTFSTGLTNTANTISLGAYNYINFYIQGTGSGGSFGLQATDASTYWQSTTFTVPADADWHLISLPLSFISATNLTKVKSLSWFFNGAGAYTIQLDDIWFENRPPTPTPTATTTFTNTPTRTPSPSPSATPTFSATPTVTPTASPSASPSASSTASPSPSVTQTVTPSPSVTDTATPVPVGSSPTSTPSISPSWTASPPPTASATPTPSPSDTPPPLASATASATPSLSSTASVTPAPSDTLTATPTTPPPGSTATATPTQSPVLSATPTASPTRSASPSGTPSASPSATPSWTPVPAGSTATATPTATSTGSGPVPTATTASSGGVGGTLQVLDGAPYPNPSPRTLRLKLDGQADLVRIRFYTVNMQLLEKLEQPGSYNGGWMSVALPDSLRDKFPNGCLYYEAEAQLGSIKTLKPKVGAFVMLR